MEVVDPLSLEAGEQIGRGSSGRVLMARSPNGKVEPLASGFRAQGSDLRVLD